MKTLIAGLLVLMLISACQSVPEYIDQDGFRFYKDGTYENLGNACSSPNGAVAECNDSMICCAKGAGPISKHPITKTDVFLYEPYYCYNGTSCPFIPG
jgi:hypothetical protein